MAKRDATSGFAIPRGPGMVPPPPVSSKQASEKVDAALAASGFEEAEYAEAIPDTDAVDAAKAAVFDGLDDVFAYGDVLELDDSISRALNDESDDDLSGNDVFDSRIDDALFEADENSGEVASGNTELNKDFEDEEDIFEGRLDDEEDDDDIFDVELDDVTDDDFDDEDNEEDDDDDGEDDDFDDDDDYDDDLDGIFDDEFADRYDDQRYDDGFKSADESEKTPADTLVSGAADEFANSAEVTGSLDLASMQDNAFGSVENICDNDEKAVHGRHAAPSEEDSTALAASSSSSGLQDVGCSSLSAASPAIAAQNIRTHSPRTWARSLARYVSAFFDELLRGGVREVVISPGSRSTPLAMIAHEAQRRFPDKIRLYVNIDERSAAFFALGLAKASGHPACVVCTSGTALANFTPAVWEAFSARVPMLIVSADRPLRLQGFDAPQTCDQMKAFGNYVRHFRQMPLCGEAQNELAFARQAAREALIAAGGITCSDASSTGATGKESHKGSNYAYGYDARLARVAEKKARMATSWPQPSAFGGSASEGWPVHINFPFEEPLMVDLEASDLFTCGRSSVEVLPMPTVKTSVSLASEVDRIGKLMHGHHVLVLAGEGSAHTDTEARNLLRWCRKQRLPLLADLLSGLRSYDLDLIIDAFDDICARQDWPQPDLIIRFGRYPISKNATRALEQARPLQIVVDAYSTRDFNASTDVYIPASPNDFVKAMRLVDTSTEAQRSFADTWIAANENHAPRPEHSETLATAEALRALPEALADIVQTGDSGSEDQPDSPGAYIQKLLTLIPEYSLLFSANSLSIRYLDAFYTKRPKHLRVLCNRGLSGIDGTLSSALGAAQSYVQTTLITGDLALLHDINSLALQSEMAHHRDAAYAGAPVLAPSVCVVLFNDNGGGIFKTLPHCSDDPAFERLFIAPQDIDFSQVAQAFRVAYRCVHDVSEFADSYQELLGTPGISLIEVSLPSLVKEGGYVATES